MIDQFDYFVVYMFPYFTLPFYFVMLGYRFWIWIRFYNPAVKLIPGSLSIYRIWSRQYRPTVEIFPGQRSRWIEIARALKGFVFFSGLFKRDSFLWIGSWLFHVSLCVVLLAHIRIVWCLPETVEQASEIIGKWSGILLLVSSGYLVVRRLLLKRVREITSWRDYLAEVLFMGVVVSGYLLASNSQTDLIQVRNILASLIQFSKTRTEIDPVLIWHFLLIQMFLVILPFSHLMHFGGIFLNRKFLGTSDTFSGEFGSKTHKG